MDWYAVRTIVRWPVDAYEERITIWSAASADAAIARASEEAVAYAQETVGGVALAIAQAYLIGDEPLGDGTEVFSLIRDSDLDSESYISRYFDTGREHQSTED